MRRAALFVTAVALTVGSVAAAPPTAAQKEMFLKECLRNSGNNRTLCTCKAEQAMSLVDTKFMDKVLKTMRGETLPVEDSRAYGTYISKSNAVCAPGM